MAATPGSSSRLLPALAPLAVVAGTFFILLLVPAAVMAAGEAALAAPGPLEFHVGGPRGWRVPDGNTSYGWWAVNNRFRVGDHLYFRYANDSVLLVERPAFDACDTAAPLAAFADGATKFLLDRPGFFCFISGAPGHCEEGQKLIVRVMVHPAMAPASAPGASSAAQPGHGGGRPGPSGGWSGAATDVAAGAGAGVTVAAAVTVLVSLVLMMLQ